MSEKISLYDGYPGYPNGLKYPWTYAMPSRKEGEKRWRVIKAAMKKRGFDCLIVGIPFGYASFTSSNRIYYISNFVPYYGEGTYVIFPSEGNPQIIQDDLIGPQFVHCAYETSWIRDIVGTHDPAQSMIANIKKQNLVSGKFGIVGYRRGAFPMPIINTLQESFPVAQFVDGNSMFREAMDEVSRTSEEELSFVKRACEIMDCCFNAVAKSFKPGVKECDMWGVAENEILRQGGWYAHFMLGTSGPAPTFHRQPPSQNVINKGDIVTFELNVTYGGVTPQVSFALCLGKPRNDVEEMYKLCDDLYKLEFEEIEKKKTFYEVEKAVVSRIHEAGYQPMTPQLHIYNMSQTMPATIPAQPGDYFTIHPAVCKKDYTAGAKFGDVVHITSKGKVERLNKIPAKLNII